MLYNIAPITESTINLEEDNYRESKDWRGGIPASVLWRVTLFKGQSHIPSSLNLNGAVKIAPGAGKQCYLLLFPTPRNLKCKWACSNLQKVSLSMDKKHKKSYHMYAPFNPAVLGTSQITDRQGFEEDTEQLASIQIWSPLSPLTPGPQDPLHIFSYLQRVNRYM